MNPLLLTLFSPAHLARTPGWIMRVRPRSLSDLSPSEPTKSVWRVF